MFCAFYFLKNYKSADNSTTKEAKEKNENIFGFLENNQILLNEMSHTALVTTKLITA
jgi:hypothetical protein